MWQTKKNNILLFAVILALYLSSIGSASAATVYVDDDGSADYTTIQDAVNNSSSGDTIIVQSGTYRETVNMNSPNLTFIGEGYPEVDGFDNYGIPDTGNEFETIKGFSIIKDGIRIEGHDSDGNVISDNRFYNCGVYLSAMEYGGLYGPGDVVEYNVFHGGGIVLSYGGDGSQKIIGNEIYDANYGIVIAPGGGASNDIGEISGNKIQGCDVGLTLMLETRVNEVYNNIFNNTVNVKMRPDSEVTQWNKSAPIQETNIIGGPYISGNYWATPNGTGFSETHLDTDGDGIAEESCNIEFFLVSGVTGSIGTTETSDIVVDYFPLVTPRTEPEPVIPSANFKANTTSGNAPLSVLFTDLSENATSRSWNFGDGATSTEKNPVHSYSLAGTYTVNLTAINPNGTDSKTAEITVLEKEEEENENENETNILPVADFTVNKTSGYYPLTVLFTDISQNVTSRSWDVNNDGVEDSNAASFVYTYTSRGTYTAKLTVSNANGMGTETATIDVERKSSGGSSSGGGGGGSPEPARNVETKELSQAYITNGKTVQFGFAKNATCVMYVSFDSKKTAGKTTTIVEQLKNKSSLVSELPAGEVYKYFNVWVGNSGFATSKNIENPVIGFKVAKAWVQDKKIDQTSIILNRYSDKEWEKLPASLSGEDDTYLYYTAEVPGFSSFAITGTTKGTSGANTEDSEPEKETRLEDEETKNMGEEVGQSAAQEGDAKAPGFEIVYGIICLSAIYLYKRK